MIERYVNSIRSRRQLRNMNQEDLALEIGVPQTHISGYETGAMIPRLDVAFRLSEFFHTHVTELFFDLFSAIAEEVASKELESKNGGRSDS